jgi:pre-mRNA-splicing factor ATP-dependent RNA helicase DHX38/PRP16
MSVLSTAQAGFSVTGYPRDRVWQTPFMSSQDEHEDEFTHQLAIKLSRALNIVNPNDLLARRVQDIAKSNPLDQFVQGKHGHSFCMVCWTRSFAAAKSFGRFSDTFLGEIHGEILSRVNQEAMGNLLQPSHGIVVQDTDVLQPEPVRQGGLMRKDVVRLALVNL